MLNIKFKCLEGINIVIINNIEIGQMLKEYEPANGTAFPGYYYWKYYSLNNDTTILNGINELTLNKLKTTIIKQLHLT